MVLDTFRADKNAKACVRLGEMRARASETVSHSRCAPELKLAKVLFDQRDYAELQKV
jgi:hypothetical protein